MRSLRLALITRQFWPLVGGAEIAMANLAVEFRSRGHDARIVTAQWDARWPAEFVHREAPVIRLPHPALRVWGTLRYMYALARWLTQEAGNLDGVLVSMLKHDAYCAVGALAKTSTAVVLRAEGAGPMGDCGWQQTASFGKAMRRRCQQADAFIAPSEPIFQELLGAGYPPDRISKVDNGVPIPPPRSLAKQQAARAALVEANQDLRAEPAGPVVVYTGRLHPDKGLADLVNAWPLIADRWPAARLWLIGDGPQRGELFDQISDMGFRYRICLPGAFDAIDEILQAADLFVLPSYSEGMSLSLLEAMALGLPVVASDIAGNRLLVEHERSGLFFPPRDAAALAAAMTRLIENPAWASELGTNAREVARQRYSLSRMADEHLAVLEQRIEEKRKGR